LYTYRDMAKNIMKFMNKTSGCKKLHANGKYTLLTQNIIQTSNESN